VYVIGTASSAMHLSGRLFLQDHFFAIFSALPSPTTKPASVEFFRSSSCVFAVKVAAQRVPVAVFELPDDCEAHLVCACSSC
jgi:hypothetical protein